MFRVLQKFSNQNIGIVIAFFIFFALCFTDSVESAQTKNSAKTKATPAKKNAKQAPTPGKKTQAKATPTPKNSKDKKGKTTSSKSETRGSDSKNKSADKSRQSSSKTNPKTSAKQTKDSKSKDSKSKDANSRQNAKNTKNDSRQSAKNTKSKDSKSDNSKNKADSKKSTSSRKDSRDTSERNSERRNTPTRNTTKSTTSTSRTTTKTEPQTSTELPQIIVTDVSARVRSQAQANAPELSRIRLGTILKVTEKNPAWYKVQYTAGGKTANGWISANSVNDLNAGAREELYRQIVDRNYKAEMDFAAASEMVDFLTQVASELGNSNSSAELELKRLLALKAALKKIPSG
ncbi:MAG TPA: SH3 domain-containing protein, partial [Pyrinomonadaceae bacterium]